MPRHRASFASGPRCCPQRRTTEMQATARRYQIRDLALLRPDGQLRIPHASEYSPCPIGAPDTAKTWAAIRHEPGLIVSVGVGRGSTCVAGRFTQSTAGRSAGRVLVSRRRVRPLAPNRAGWRLRYWAGPLHSEGAVEGVRAPGPAQVQGAGNGVVSGDVAEDEQRPLLGFADRVGQHHVGPGRDVPALRGTGAASPTRSGHEPISRDRCRLNADIPVRL